MATSRSGPSGEPQVSGGGRSPGLRRAAFGALTVAAVVAAGSVLTACSSSSSPPPTSAPAHSATVAIRNFAFVPSTLQVAPGAVVQVFNEDQVPHTLTASHGQFGTGNIPAGQSKSFTAPTAPGTYGYTCTIHPYMTGTLVVT